MRINRVQSLELAFGSGDTTQTGTLTNFGMASQIVPFASSKILSDSTLRNNSTFDIEVISNTEVRATRPASGVAADIRVFAVEFSRDTTVQSGTWALGSTDTTTNNSISAVDRSKTFALHYTKVSSGGPTPSISATACRIPSTTSLQILRNTSGVAASGHWYTIGSNSLSVQYGDVTHTDGGGIEQSWTINAVNTANTFLVASLTTTETTDPDEGEPRCYLKDTTTVTSRRGYSTSGVSSPKFFVVSDSEIGVQRYAQSTLTTGTGTRTINSIDLNRSIVKSPDKIGVTDSTIYSGPSILSCRHVYYNFNDSTTVAWTKQNGRNAGINFEVIQFRKTSIQTHIIDTRVIG